jgi:hypothetical protein
MHHLVDAESATQKFSAVQGRRATNSCRCRSRGRIDCFSQASFLLGSESFGQLFQEYRHAVIDFPRTLSGLESLGDLFSATSDQ